jgi:hypothetical protein
MQTDQEASQLRVQQWIDANGIPMRFPGAFEAERSNRA